MNTHTAFPTTANAHSASHGARPSMGDARFALGWGVFALGSLLGLSEAVSWLSHQA